MKRFYLFFTAFCLCTVVSFANIFNDKDSLNLSIGIETQKFPSGVIDVNYQFEPSNKLYTQIGTQTRLMNGWKDYQSTYVGLLLDFDNFEFDKTVNPDRIPGNSERSLILPEKDKEHKFYLLLRTGISNSLDSNDIGLYAATGIQYGHNRYIRVMLESEDGKLRNTIMVGMKFNSLKFY